MDRVRADRLTAGDVHGQEAGQRSFERVGIETLGDGGTEELLELAPDDVNVDGDTGVLDDDRFFDVQVTYAKAAPDDLCITITATNHGPT